MVLGFGIFFLLCLVTLAALGWVFWDRQQQRFSDSVDKALDRDGASGVDAMGRAYGEAGRHGASPPGLSLRLGRWALGLFQRHRDEPDDRHDDRRGGRPRGPHR